MNIFEKISDCILNMDEESIEQLIKVAIDKENVAPQDIYLHGLNAGMGKAIERYNKKEIDLPELIVCADTLNRGVKVLRQFGNVENNKKEKVLLSVVAGDTHEIGKNIVKILLEAAGYEIIDLGVNVSVDKIIETAFAEQVKIIGLSSMMTTTRGEMKKLIDTLETINLQNKPYVIIGGGSVTANYSQEINASGYAPNAPETIKLIEQLLHS